MHCCTKKEGMAARQRLCHLVCNVWRRLAWSSFNERVLMMRCFAVYHLISKKHGPLAGTIYIYVQTYCLLLVNSNQVNVEHREEGVLRTDKYMEIILFFKTHCILVLEHSTGFALTKLPNTNKNSLTLVHAKTIHYLHVKVLSFLLILNKPNPCQYIIPRRH